LAEAVPERRAESGRGVARRIAVLRALPGLGDLLCAVPALRALRAAFPFAEISLIGLPSAGWFADRFARYVDRLVPLTAWPGLPETPGPAEEARAFLARAKAAAYDLALQLHGDGTVTNNLIARLGAARVGGMASCGGPRPDAATFPVVSADASEVERLLTVLRTIGVDAPQRELEWPERAADLAELATAAPGLSVRSYAVLHPGSSLPSRRWEVGGFAAVGDRLTAAGLDVVITGVDSERDVTADVAHTMASPALDLAGSCSLGAAAALVRRAAIVVTNDTGMSHLAAAVGTPSVVVFLVTDPRRWKPEAPIHVAVRAGDDVSGTAGRVLSAADTLLGDRHPRRRRPLA
jgi:ADP-heptose:LPS heptosyltransferase